MVGKLVLFWWKSLLIISFHDGDDNDKDYGK